MGPQPDPQGVFKHKLKQSFGRFLGPCNDITCPCPIPYTGCDCAHTHVSSIGRELGHAASTLYCELDAHVLSSSSFHPNFLNPGPAATDPLKFYRLKEKVGTNYNTTPGHLGFVFFRRDPNSAINDDN